ncbi:MAG: hypothetical protein A2X66_06730, partial [Ignavibacteria bacterium GWA2_54_16]
MNITVQSTNRGAASNSVGFYLIPKLPPGIYEVSASVMGYVRAFKKVTLKPGESSELSFQLAQTAIETQEVVVQGSKKHVHTDAGTSVHVLDKQDIKMIPGVAQQDLLHALQIVPGIVSTSDVSSRFYVRGGSGDQNLFLLDGMKVYYPFHALGIYSVFNANLVDNVEVYTGAFPPGFGGRLSSVVNIVTRDGRSDRFSTRTNINFLSAEAEAEGPAFENSSWLLDIRKSLFSQTLSHIVGQHLPVSFYDGIFKLSAQPGGMQKFDLTVLSSGDNLISTSAAEPDYHWRNNGFSISGSHLPTDRVFVQWILYGSIYSAERNAKSAIDITSASTSVKHFGLRTTATVYAGPKDMYYFGFEFGEPWLSYRFFNRMAIPMDLGSSFIEFSGWVRYQAQIERLQLDVGLHAELGPLLEGGGVTRELQPRINLCLELNGGWKAKASYARFTQRMLTVGNEDEVMSIFEGWIKVPVYLPSEQADHFVAGFSGNVGPSIFVNSEAFYKSYGSLIVYNWDKANVTDPDYIQGTADSYGIEVMARSSYSYVDFYGAYSLSWAQINNRGMTYYPRYDRRHHLNLMAVARPFKSFSATLRWEFGSGFPFSQSVGYIMRPSLDDALPGRFEFGSATPYMLLGPKNAARLPSYHRLDANIAYDTRIADLDISLGVDLFNVY